MNRLFAHVHGTPSTDENSLRLQHLTFPRGRSLIAGKRQRHRPDHSFVYDTYVAGDFADTVLATIACEPFNWGLLATSLGKSRYLKWVGFRAAGASPGRTVIVGGPLAATAPAVRLRAGMPEQWLIWMMGEGEEPIRELQPCREPRGTSPRWPVSPAATASSTLDLEKARRHLPALPPSLAPCGLHCREAVGVAPDDGAEPAVHCGGPDSPRQCRRADVAARPGALGPGPGAGVHCG